MGCKYEFNLSEKKKKTFLSLSKKENKQPSEVYSKISLIAITYRWMQVA